MGPIQVQNIDLPLAIAGISTVILTVARFSKWNTVKAAKSDAVEPPLLPGGLPILGHALAFNNDSSKVHQAAK